MKGDDEMWEIEVIGIMVKIEKLFFALGARSCGTLCVLWLVNTAESITFALVKYGGKNDMWGIVIGVDHCSKSTQ